MHSLNPFLRAFFRSTLPTQCNPVSQHILLVPTTEVLLTCRDRETNTTYADLAQSEEFLASHVIRVPVPENGKTPQHDMVRDSRGKAKQFTTLNGRTVVVKESFVYSNKGFRNLNQALLLSDVLYYPNSIEAQQWLIYYISKPLLGSLEPVKITPATLPNLYAGIRGSPVMADSSGTLASGSLSTASTPRKKEIMSFNELLNHFPMIARQMQSGLERVFKEFHHEMDKRAASEHPLPTSSRSRRASSVSTSSRVNGSIHSHLSNGHIRAPAITSIADTLIDDDEDHMRRTLETAVTAAIDLFQLVDKQQLSLLGATTDLTGPLVERLIERYVTEQLHDSVLFSRLCKSREFEDLELESRIHQMENLDITQVGIEIDGGREGKKALMLRLNLGLQEFRKLGVAGSPQQMMDIVLETLKLITVGDASPTATNHASQEQASLEKPTSVLAMNADTLVSLLLLVVIRSQVRHLGARLAYMRSFIFIEDVEIGEKGYALSTFEAVLSYLNRASSSLRNASRKNKRLWQSTMNGDIKSIKAMLVSEEISSAEGEEDGPEIDEGAIEDDCADGIQQMTDTSSSRISGASTDINGASEDSRLAHVFPFQAAQQRACLAEPPLRKIKRVSMDMRSVSNASEYSFKSRTTTIDSRASAFESDTAIDKLAQTQNPAGESVLRMAVEARQPQSLKYLLSLHDYYTTETVLEDTNSEGTTLLSAAVQLSNTELIDILLEYLFSNLDDSLIFEYLSKADDRGRTMAHYLFNAPHLIKRFGASLPWRRKDKNGQTPLFALCRSYDHQRYTEMVHDALEYATREQNDGEPLHLDDHVDNKGNTLLHVLNDPLLTQRMLRYCDADANAPNDKRFTPLMVASKYGRVDMVRVFFGEPRVDVNARESRGMTAVELAKDDDVRNRIDDMVLISNIPAADGRVTSVVRSFFVEDASIRLIIKSAVRDGHGMIILTTCRRSLADFENLARWLAMEHPASWLPSIFNFRSPYQIPSRPSRAVLHDIQVRLNKFLMIMLSHSTFSIHELLWEFVLFPEIQPEMMADRSRKKAELRSEKIKEEYEPVDDIKEVEVFVGHARDTIRGIHHSSKSALRRVNNIRAATCDIHIAMDLCTRALSTLPFLPTSHITALHHYASTLAPAESDPYTIFHSSLLSISSTIFAMLSSLARPQALIASLSATRAAIDRHASSLRRSDRWPLGLLDETRKSIHADAEEKVWRAKEELRAVGCELRYTQQTVAGELAGWQELHARMGRRAVRELAKGMVVRERVRLEGMRRAVRGVVELRI